MVLVLSASFFVEAKSRSNDNVELITSFTTSGEIKDDTDVFKRTDSSTFKHHDTIFYFANFTWADIEDNGGRHKTVYKWYSNGKIIGALKWKGKFETAPWEVRSSMHAATLGYGNHKVELYVDGVLVDAKEFEVKK